MAASYRTFDSTLLCRAWSVLEEYYEFRRTARYRKKIEEQLRDSNIPLTHVPWKSMIRAVLCQSLFSDEQLKEMNAHTEESYTAMDIVSNDAVVNLLLENDEDDEDCLTNTWFEVDELKKRFQRAVNIIPPIRRERQEMCHRILGYPTGYSEEETDYGLIINDNEPVDLVDVLTIDEQNQMRTGDLIELSGNRLHDAFYIYRLPEKGIWAQIQQMWSKHQIIDFQFHSTEMNPTEEEIIFVPAMDEYGYGIPYLFATRPNELLPEDALYKYVDINCPLTAMFTEDPTIALVQKHLDDRLKNPVYQDKYIGEEMSIKLNRFPQEYVAFVHINHGPEDNVVWTHRVHYNGKEIATDLNDNREIFFSRLILKAEEQYRQKQSN